MLPFLCCCFFVFSTVLGGDKTSDISQFWANDYKIFDQIYGRTSDKELYGATLPPTVTYNIDITKPIQLQASDKKEWYIPNEKLLDPKLYNDLNDKNAKLISNYLYTKKTKPALQFISFSDSKPISESNDPDTYNYLKHLEQITKHKNGIQKTSSQYSDAEADEAYKSIQEILDAHEANKKESGESNGERTKTKKVKSSVEDLRYTRNRNRSKVRQINGNSLKSRDVSSRFRKSPVSHVASRPYLRKIRYHYTM